MGSLADVTLGDIARAIGRYRPFLVALAVLLVVLQVLPDRGGDVSTGRDAGDETATAGGTQLTSDEAEGAEGADEVIEDEEAFADDDAAFEDEGDAAFGDGDGGAFEEDDAAFDEEAFDDEEFSEDDPTLEDDDGAGFDDGETGFGDDFDSPLFVVEFGWATATAGTPLAASEVPDGSMPVGKRIGQNDKISFVRLEGTTDVLELHEHAEGQRTPPVGEVGLRMCQSEDSGWDSGGGKTFDEAPSYNAGACVDGERAEDGTWTFDLSGFAEPADPRGFVLIPAADAAVDFQVAFDPHA